MDICDCYTVSEETQSRNFEFSIAWVAVDFSLFQYLSFGLSDDFLLKCVLNVISIAFIFLQVYIVMHDSPESQLHIAEVTTCSFIYNSHISDTLVVYIYSLISNTLVVHDHMSQ